MIPAPAAAARNIRSAAANKPPARKILEVLSNWEDYAAEADAGNERIKEIKTNLELDIKKS